MTARRTTSGGSRPRTVHSRWRHYVSPIDDGELSALIKPGSKGYGFLPWIMDVSSCGCGNEHATCEVTQGSPWWSPGFVTWQSPLGTDGNLRADVIDSFAIEGTNSIGINTLSEGRYFTGEMNIIDLSIPCVQVTPHTFPDAHGGARTLEMQGMMEDTFESFLLPVWSLITVSERFWHTWRRESFRYWEAQFPWLARYDVLTDAFVDFDEQHEGNKECDPESDEYAGECVCGFDKHMAEMLKAIENDTSFADGIETEQSRFEDGYDYAIEKVREGWRLCHQHAADGDPASAVLGESHSPYWLQDVRGAAQARELAAS